MALNMQSLTTANKAKLLQAALDIANEAQFTARVNGAKDLCYPIKAEIFRRAGVSSMTCLTQTGYMVYAFRDGGQANVIPSRTPVSPGINCPGPFKESMIVETLKRERDAELNDTSFLVCLALAGVMSYTVDLNERTRTFYGAGDESYVDTYQHIMMLAPYTNGRMA
jgi:uncharacterized protein YbcV (DUF1398 family)